MGYYRPMTRTETALRYFDEGCDCGKAILHAYEPVLNLDAKTRERYRASCSQLPGSPAEQCEAVSGAFEVLSHLYGPEAGGSADLLARFKARFMATHDSTTCKKLLGYDLTYVKDLATVIETDAVGHVCRELVMQTCAILDDIIEEAPR